MLPSILQFLIVLYNGKRFTLQIAWSLLHMITSYDEFNAMQLLFHFHHNCDKMITL